MEVIDDVILRFWFSNSWLRLKVHVKLGPQALEFLT